MIAIEALAPVTLKAIADWHIERARTLHAQAAICRQAAEAAPEKSWERKKMVDAALADIGQAAEALLFAQIIQAAHL